MFADEEERGLRFGPFRGESKGESFNDGPGEYIGGGLAIGGGGVLSWPLVSRVGLEESMALSVAGNVQQRDAVPPRARNVL